MAQQTQIGSQPQTKGFWESSWYCRKCGACCRVAVKDVPNLNRGDGICKNLDMKTNLCKIYEERPIICRVDEGYDKLFRHHLLMSKEQYYQYQSMKCYEAMKDREDG